MVEVSGPEGAMLVHRHWTEHWTDKDLVEAASTLPDPAQVGGHTGSSHADQVQPWEAHLCNSFLLGLKPELSNAIKQHCVGYARQPLSVIEDHAKNHENLLNSQARKRFRAKQRKRIRRKTDQLFSQINNNSNMRRMAMRTGLTVRYTIPWKDVSPWALQVARAKDWADTECPNVQYSASTKTWKCPFQYRLKAEPTVELLGPPPLVQAATLTEEEELELASLPPQLWASSKYDVGLIKDCEPVSITLKSAYRPRQAQYPLKPKAIEGIRPVFHALCEAGVIVPYPDSPVRAPEVPNPHTILSQIPTDHTHYTVVDLANAFFSVPVSQMAPS
ncbi:hypothetical protein SRHO_G00072170 [Serrasalmus rhombeus]